MNKRKLKRLKSIKDKTENSAKKTPERAAGSVVSPKSSQKLALKKNTKPAKSEDEVDYDTGEDSEELEALGWRWR